MNTRTVKVPAEAVRTREQVLAGAVIRGGYVWATCHNCGGTGTYPSSMLPPGMCRLYCWRGRTPETYGRLPHDVDAYVARAQRADRAAYRATVRAQEAAQARAARELQQTEALTEALTVSRHVGVPGERLTVRLEVSFVSDRYEGQFGTFCIVRFRDDAGNVLTWFASGAFVPARGERGTFRFTVKKHETYRGEAQTLVTRVARAKEA